jgi:predicted aspartyl protease
VLGERGPHRWLHLVVVIASIAAALHLALPSSNIPLPKVQLPALTGGCAATTPVGNETTTVPVTINRSSNTVQILTTLCIDGQGPFPFVVDSGAVTSVISTALSQHLGLSPAGRSNAISGVGCSSTAAPTTISSWSWHGLALSAQSVASINIPGYGVTTSPAGLLGADVLSRFGAVRIDYARSLMTVIGREGAPLPSGQHAANDPATIPTALTKGTPQVTESMTVTVGGSAVQGTVPVSFPGGSPEPFVVDTGAATSAVDQGASGATQLLTTGGTETENTVCSVVKNPLVHTGTWFVGAAALPPAIITKVALGLRGVDGLLGSDVYATYGSIVIDFGQGELILGAG